MNNYAIFYHFYTPLHFGSGTTMSYVDLPVEREIHTNYPVMPSTGIKGVFRASYKKAKGDDKTDKLFGKGEEEGKLIFTDGKLIFFPVKSARGVFVWITSPLALQRFVRDLNIVKAGFKIDNLDRISFDNDEQAFVSDDNITVNEHLILEEMSFRKKEKIDFDWIDQLGIEIDKKRVAIISNDMFSYYVKNATEVNARIRIDQTKGTADEGALWYEELVPEESVFYSLVLERSDDIAGEFKNFIAEDKKALFQFGGDETLGRGFAKVKLFEGR